MDRRGRTIFKNPGTGGKFYVLNGTKKVYSINKNFEASNDPGYYTVEQLKNIAKAKGLTGYSKMKKAELFDTLKRLMTVKGVQNKNIRNYIIKHITVKSRGNVSRNLGVNIQRVRKIHKQLRNEYFAYVYNPNKNRYKTFANIINRHHDY